MGRIRGSGREMLPSRDEVLTALAGGTDYAAVGRAMHLPPGVVFMVATGLPADGGDAVAPEDLAQPGLLPGSSQHLANPPAQNPTSKPDAVHDWIRRRALADPAMQGAAADRNAEPGGSIGAEEDTSVTVVLGRDHGRIKAMLEELSAIPGVKEGGSEADLSRRQSIVDMVTVAASRHESVEAEHFWPTVRKLLGDGDDLAERAIEQEQKGAEILADLGKLTGREERFDDLVEDLVAALRQHVALEDRVFLALHDVVDDEEKQAWGDRIRRSEKWAPTRPHPRAPRRSATALKSAGAGAAALDKVRDTVGSRPAERKGQAPAGARRRADRRTGG